MPTHYQGSPDQIRALNVFIKLTRATDAFLARVACHQTMADLTLSQFGVLEAVYHLGPMSQKEIGQKLLKSGGNMTLVIDNLVKRGLVVRTRSTSDRRVMLVSLTEAGEELIGRLFPQHVAAVTEEMSVLSADEQEQLGALLRKVGTGRADDGRQ